MAWCESNLGVQVAVGHPPIKEHRWGRIDEASEDASPLLKMVTLIIKRIEGLEDINGY